MASLSCQSACDASCGSTKSYGSIRTAESPEELQARIKEIAKSAALSAQETKSYNSACTAECEEDLVARIKEIARVSPPAPMHQQPIAATSQQLPMTTLPVAPSSGFTFTSDLMGSSQSSMHLHALPLQVLVPVAFPLKPFSYGQVACPCIDVEDDLEDSMPTMEIPDRKRVRSLHLKRGPVEAHGGLQLAQGPSRKRSMQQKQGVKENKVLPEASEEVWNERFGKRMEAVRNLKSSPVYYEHQDIPKTKRPKSPDVYNRNLSKRDWEMAMAQWRAEWREVDGVCYLRSMGYKEFASRKAWNKAGECMAKKKAQKDKDPPGAEKVSQEQLHREHKALAVEILCQ